MGAHHTEMTQSLPRPLTPCAQSGFNRGSRGIPVAARNSLLGWASFSMGTWPNPGDSKRTVAAEDWKGGLGEHGQPRIPPTPDTGHVVIRTHSGCDPTVVDTGHSELCCSGCGLFLVGPRPVDHSAHSIGPAVNDNRAESASAHELSYVRNGASGVGWGRGAVKAVGASSLQEAGLLEASRKLQAPGCKPGAQQVRGSVGEEVWGWRRWEGSCGRC